jgi:hypothetical protein
LLDCEWLNRAVLRRHRLGGGPARTTRRALPRHLRHRRLPARAAAARPASPPAGGDRRRGRGPRLPLRRLRPKQDLRPPRRNAAPAHRPLHRRGRRPSRHRPHRLRSPHHRQRARRCPHRSTHLADPAAQASFEQATATPGSASTELKEAWRNAYGRNGDPSDAWDRAIKVVEAILLPTILPKQDVGTLLRNATPSVFHQRHIGRMLRSS